MRDRRHRLRRVVDAFLDGAAIDWGALRRRSRSPHDKPRIEGLQFLDALRQHATRADERQRCAASAWPAGLPAVLRAVAVLAGVQTAAALVGVTLGAAKGGLEAPVPQLALTLAFGAAGVFFGIGPVGGGRRPALVTASLATASAFARSLTGGMPAPWALFVRPLLHGIVPEVFTPTCLWLLALRMPAAHRFTAFDSVARTAAAVTCLSATAVFLVNLADVFRPVSGAGLAWMLRGHSSHVFWHAYTLALAMPVAALAMRAHTALPRERRLVARLAWTIAIGAGPFLALGLVRTAVPSLDKRAPGPGNLAAYGWVDSIVLASLAAMPLACALALAAQRAGDTREGPSARRGALPRVGWSSSRARWAAPRAVWRSPRAVWAAPRTVWRHDEVRAMASALERIRASRGLAEGCRALADGIADTTGARHVHVLLASDDGAAFTSLDRSTAPLARDTALAAAIADTPALLDVSPSSPLFPLLPSSDRRWLAAAGAELIASLRYPDDGVAGVVALVRKRNGGAFDARDDWLVGTLTAAFDCRRPAAAGRRQAAAFQCPACGGVSAFAVSPCGCGVRSDPAALPARLSDSLVVTRRLGSGTTGSVYLAHDTVLGRDVAVKAARHPGSSPARALVREARAMASLNHPALATIYGLRVWHHTPLLIVEYFPHGTLARRLERGTLAIDEVAALGATLAGGLAYMHGKGRVHRDLKPSNIGLTACDTPKLLDFGLAGRPIAWGAERTGALDGPVAGTSAYLPPEACSGGPIDAACDLWALSAVLLEALTGSPDPRLLDVHPLSSAPLPSALRAFFAHALDSRPSRRYADAREWIDGFEAGLRA